METRDTLVWLGLSKNEATVYLQLLRLGETKAGLVAQKAKLNRTSIYEALRKLM